MAVQLDLFRSLHYNPPALPLPLDIVANGRISGKRKRHRYVAGSDLHHPLCDDITRSAAHWTALRGSGI